MLRSHWIPRALLMALLTAGGAMASAETTAPGETTVPEHLKHVVQDDLAGIERAALDYAESWYAGDRAQMEKALHADLCKRTVRRAGDRDRVDHMSALTLSQGAGKGWGKKTPPDQRQKDVVILDVFRDVATVRLEMRGWVDYMHIVKTNGEWKIVNVLWQSKPKE